MTSLPFLRGLRLAAALAALTAAAFAADATRKNFNVPADTAERALKQLAAQSGHEVLFATEMTAGVRTNPVRGEFTALEAANQLLADTGLVAVQDERTGTLTINRAPKNALEKNAPSRRVSDVAANSRPVELDKFEVTGSRIRGVFGEGTINPVLTFSRADIERSGVASLADFRQLVPQLSVGANVNNGYNGGYGAGARVNFELRGIGTSNTLVLVDGRRMPKSDQSNGLDNYDLNGIPLSAVERIEVLLDGASAIYGADAQAGVINIILKKDYVGTELEVSYDNTFDTDAAVTRVSLFSGVRRGPFSLNVSGSWEKTNALSYIDRRPMRPLDPSDFNLLTGGTGRVFVNSGNLPGLNRSSAAIPRGSNGVNVTVADYDAAGVQTALVDPNAYVNLLNPSNRRSLTANAAYKFTPAVEVFVNARWSQFRNYNSSYPKYLFSTIPAGAPGNPFGVNILTQKIFWDLGPRAANFITRTPSVTAGVRGELPHDWRYEAAVSWTEAWSAYDPYNANFFGTLLSPALRDADPARRPILLYDSTAGSVNQPVPIESLTAAFYTQEWAETWAYDFKADGTVFQLPAGPLKLAFGGELREEYVRFDRSRLDFFYNQVVTRPTSRDVSAGFAETFVPLVSTEQAIPFVHQLAATLAVRTDRYSDFGDSTNPRYGLIYRPVKNVLLRGSVSETFKAPLLAQLFRPELSGTAFLGAGFLFDTARNEERTGLVDTISGGTLNLSAEKSENENLGVVIEVPRVSGLTLAADYWKIRIFDRVGGLAYQDLFTLFPDRFQREPAGADGRPGRITLIDTRPVNIAEFRTSGIDYRLTWRGETAWGRVLFDANLTKTLTYESRIKPDASPSLSHLTEQRPLRGVAQLYVERGPWSGGVTAVYQDSYVYGFGSESPSTTEWSATIGYDFGQRGSSNEPRRWWQRGLEDTRLTLAVQNLFNLDPNGDRFDGTDLGNVDPRLRRYIVTLRKKF